MSALYLLQARQDARNANVLRMGEIARRLNILSTRDGSAPNKPLPTVK